MPDQVMPDQVMPDQVIPDHVMPDQVMPDQVIPDHVMPDHVMPDQVIPDHVMPDHVMPDQVMPFQLVRLRRPAGQVRASKARPRTSTSPRTCLPPTVTCTEPRESSREPTPVDSANFCTASGVGAVRAPARLIIPLPCWVAVAPGTGLAVPMSRALIWSGGAGGRCWARSGAAPEANA